MGKITESHNLKKELSNTSKGRSPFGGNIRITNSTVNENGKQVEKLLNWEKARKMVIFKNYKTMKL